MRKTTYAEKCRSFILKGDIFMNQQNKFEYEVVDTYRGYKYVIYLNTRLGYRCGYVQIPNTHPLQEAFFGDVDISSVALTYSGKLKELDGFYFGWDHNHLWDGVDEDAIKLHHPDKADQYIEEAESLHEGYGRYYSKDDVEQECKALIDELLSKYN